jgi:hypothetical protein
LVAGCVCAVSIPGRAVANFLNNALILKPALALVSIKRMPSLVDLSSPSSTETCRLSLASVLFPTKTIITSFPRSFRTSSIHLEVFRKEARSSKRTRELDIERGMGEQTCDIIDDHSNRGVTDIRWNQGTKSFLSSCVPKL